MAVISLSLTVLNTAINSLFIVFFSLLKLLIPIPAISRRMGRMANLFMQNWLRGNALVLRLANRIDWQIIDRTQLNAEGWHLIICNHLSWTDIVILGDLFRSREEDFAAEAAPTGSRLTGLPTTDNQQPTTGDPLPVRCIGRRPPEDPQGRGIHSVSPGTAANRPSRQSAFACSMRSARLETKFHQR